MFGLNQCLTSSFEQAPCLTARPWFQHSACHFIWTTLSVEVNAFSDSSAICACIVQQLLWSLLSAKLLNVIDTFYIKVYLCRISVNTPTQAWSHPLVLPLAAVVTSPSLAVSLLLLLPWHDCQASCNCELVQVSSISSVWLFLCTLLQPAQQARLEGAMGWRSRAHGRHVWAVGRASEQAARTPARTEQQEPERQRRRQRRWWRRRCWRGGPRRSRRHRIQWQQQQQQQRLGPWRRGNRLGRRVVVGHSGWRRCDARGGHHWNCGLGLYVAPP